MSGDEKSGINLPTWAIAILVGGFGFFANDFVAQRDAEPTRVEDVLREVVALQLAPLAGSLTDVKAELREYVSQNRSVIQDLSRRVALVENRQAVESTTIEAVSDRVDRIGTILRDSAIFERRDD